MFFMTTYRRVEIIAETKCCALILEHEGVIVGNRQLHDRIESQDVTGSCGLHQERFAVW